MVIMMEAAGQEDKRSPAISVVLPCLDEHEALPQAVAGVLGQITNEPLELILADGGSRDGTIEAFLDLTRNCVARGWAAKVVVSERSGRAAQMNAGARVATGDSLLFLHADTWLNPAAVRAVLQALRDPRVAGGGFRHSFRERSAILKLISLWATGRSILRGIHYGDQAMFIRREVFEAVGGFPEIPLFEDLELARAMKTRGRVTTLPMAAVTSARRLRRGGVLKTGLLFAWLRLRYALGADPARLKAVYPDVR
jgi:rSAM/selenodomain-associated transferase 2